MAQARLLVPVRGTETRLGLVQAAFLMAGLLVRDGGRAHVEGVHIQPSSADGAQQLSFARLASGIAASGREDLIEAAEREARLGREGARRRFEDIRRGFEAVSETAPGLTPATSVESAPLSASWREEDGDEASILCERGRLADLVVLPGPRADGDPRPYELFRNVVPSLGRPVLIVPQSKVDHIARSVVIGWNRSALSARAVAAALPFLHAAEKVTVVCVTTGAKSGPGTRDLVEYLRWHGIPAEARDVAPDHRRVGDILLYEARRARADLVVAGAYGGNRWREQVLGGVTEHLFSDTDIPLLMIH